MSNKLAWLNHGYQLFGQEGPNGLKIERISREIGVNKSSFYHHFADLDLFTEELLHLHEQKGQLIVQRFMQCQRIDPDLIHLLIEIKADVLFQRQLRIHRHRSDFARCIEIVHAPIEEGLLMIWCEALELNNHERLGNMLLKLTVENFYLRLTEENLNERWLRAYINELKDMVQHFSGNLVTA
jgi:AcrR family transcriptional regulator